MNKFIWTFGLMLCLATSDGLAQQCPEFFAGIGRPQRAPEKHARITDLFFDQAFRRFREERVVGDDAFVRIVQRESTIQDASPRIKSTIERIHRLSVGPNGEREVAAIVVHMEDGSTKVTLATSNNASEIDGLEINKAIDRAISRSQTPVKRVQIFHTHPGNDPEANSLSNADVRFADGTSNRLRTSHSLRVPVDIIAAPTQLRATGTVYTYTAYPKSPTL